ELLVTDAPVTAANRAALEARSKSGPVVWITPWGLDPAWAERPSSALTPLAAAGWMNAVGEPEGPPLAPPGAIPQFMGGLFATIEALSYEPGASPGLSVISIAESLLATTIYDAMAFQYHGVTRERAGKRFARTQSTL